MIITCVATDGNESSFGKRYALLRLGVALPKCHKNSMAARHDLTT